MKWVIDYKDDILCSPCIELIVHETVFKDGDFWTFCVRENGGLTVIAEPNDSELDRFVFLVTLYKTEKDGITIYSVVEHDPGCRLTTVPRLVRTSKVLQDVSRVTRVILEDFLE